MQFLDANHRKTAVFLIDHMHTNYKHLVITSGAPIVLRRLLAFPSRLASSSFMLLARPYFTHPGKSSDFDNQDT